MTTPDNNPNTSSTPPGDDNFGKNRDIVVLVYALQAVSFLLGITFIAGVIVNYVKLDDVRGTWLESHFRWQIRSFWFSLLWTLLGILTAMVFVGYLILFANMVWLIYRIIKGWIRLSENKPMYALP